MRLKFLQPAAEPDQGYKKDTEYDFVDQAKAQRFIDAGIAAPVEMPATKPEPRQDAKPAKPAK